MAAATYRDSSGISQALCDQILRPGRDVVHFPAAAVFNIQLTELLAVAAAAAIVRLQNQVSLLRQIESPWIEVQCVLPFRPAVNPQNRRVANAGLKAQRLVKNAADFEPVFARITNHLGITQI